MPVLHRNGRERRKGDRLLTLWDAQHRGGSLPAWTSDFLDQCPDLKNYCLAGTLDQEASKVHVNHFGHHHKSNLGAAGVEHHTSRYNAAIVFDQILKSAKSLETRLAPLLQSREFRDLGRMDRPLKSRFVVLPFEAKQDGALPWVALADWRYG